MGDNIVKVIGLVIAAICLFFFVISFLIKEQKLKRISNAISTLSVIAVLIPYFWAIPIGKGNEVQMYYGNLEEINNMQEKYTQIVDENYNLKGTIDEQNELIDNLKSQVKELNSEQNDQADTSEIIGTGIDFKDISNVLYDGLQYSKYDGTNNETFMVAGEEHRVGFVIENDGSLFAIDDPGYVLFNLEGKYSKVICNVGRMYGDDTETLYITSSDGLVDMTYDVRADAAIQTLEIPLNYAQDLKIALNTGMSVRYGFYNVIFYQ